MLRFPRTSDTLKALALVAVGALLAGVSDTASKPDPIRQMRTGASRGCSVSTLAGDRGFGRAADEHAYFDDDLTRPSLRGPTAVTPTRAASPAAVLPDAPPGPEPPASRFVLAGPLPAAPVSDTPYRLPAGRAPPLS